MSIDMGERSRDHCGIQSQANSSVRSHDAQECFCGEEGCVGFIGGKTQTDIGIMDDLFLDALGIADEVEELQLKGSKKKKSFKLDEDYTVRPLLAASSQGILLISGLYSLPCAR